MAHARQNGAAVRTLRQRSGIKVGELAQRVRVAPQTIWNIENGHNVASIEVLYRIASELSVDVEDLLSEDGLRDLKAAS